MFGQVRLWIVAAGLIPAVWACAHAGEAESSTAEVSTIEKIEAAYGGDRLMGMESISIIERVSQTSAGQGHGPGAPEFQTARQRTHLDPGAGRGSIENYVLSAGFVNHSRVVSTPDSVIGVNYLSGRFQPRSDDDYYSAFGPMIRSSDTMLAYEAVKHAETVSPVGSSMFQGRPHDLVSFELPASPPLTLEVDSETGLISRMTRETDFGALTYYFSDHRVADGIPYAANFQFSVDGYPNILTQERKVAFGAAPAGIFSLDDGLAAEGSLIDTSEMTVDEIAPGVHLTGQGIGYSLFVDAGEHVIGAGGYAGLAERFDAYRRAAGHEKPLAYQIVTHHHSDHVAGLGEAYELGATLVMPANAEAAVSAVLGAEIDEGRVRRLDGAMTIGPVEIHEITTVHTAGYALVHVPAAGAVFQADHYNGAFEAGPGDANQGAVSLLAEVERLDIQPGLILSAHGRKVETWTAFRQAVAAFDPQRCFNGREICGGEY